MTFWPCLLALLFSSCEATHFLGTVMTYHPKSETNGSQTVVLRYKTNFHSCLDIPWSCRSGDCGTSSVRLNNVDAESSGEWCQTEGIMTRVVPSNDPFELMIDGGDWIANMVNNIRFWRAVTLVDLSHRSDTGQANRSPQTTNIPAIRVPSNCQRNLDFLVFDPDGDEVRCRYGVSSAAECNPCTPPSVVSLSSNCTLSYLPSTNNVEGPYAVQLVMEDFPRQTITLSSTSGVQTMVTTDRISKIPFQFVLRVDPSVPDCTEGLYLPRYLPPTPHNGASLSTSVNQTIEIVINCTANMSTISELLFSGPYNSVETLRSPGVFDVTWTPSEQEAGESHPFCFIVQATLNTSKYHSDLRCVVVTVEEGTGTTTTPAAPSTTHTSTAVLTPDTLTPPDELTTLYTTTLRALDAATTFYTKTTQPTISTASLTTTQPTISTASLTTTQSQIATAALTTTQGKVATAALTTTQPTVATAAITTTQSIATVALTTTQGKVVTAALTTTQGKVATAALTTMQSTTATAALTTTQPTIASAAITTTQSIATAALTTTQGKVATAALTTTQGKVATAALTTTQGKISTAALTTMQSTIATVAITTTQSIATAALRTTQQTIATAALSTTQSIATSDLTTTQPKSSTSPFTTKQLTNAMTALTTTQPKIAISALATTQPTTVTVAPTTKRSTIATAPFTSKQLTTATTAITATQPTNVTNTTAPVSLTITQSPTDIIATAATHPTNVTGMTTYNTNLTITHPTIVTNTPTTFAAPQQSTIVPTRVPTTDQASKTTRRTTPPATFVASLRVKVASLTELTAEALNELVLQQMKDQLALYGVSNFTVRVVGRT